MARAETTDFFQSFRFHVKAGPAFDGSVFLDPQAGFQSVSTPEYSLDNVEYREGLYKYTRKYPGVPSTNELSLARGVARKGTAFYDWVKTAIEGGEYRIDLDIRHFHRADGPGFSTTSASSRSYLCLECFPTRVKVAADLDSQTSDVSIEELDLVFEEFELQENDVPPTPFAV